jgi:hypothetical protein
VLGGRQRSDGKWRHSGTVKRPGCHIDRERRAGSEGGGEEEGGDEEDLSQRRRCLTHGRRRAGVAA